MDRPRSHALTRPLARLGLLRKQLQLIVPLLALAEGHPDTGMLLARLSETAAGFDAILTAAAPQARDAIQTGLKRAAAEEYNEARSEFLAAYHLISVLLQPRRP